MLLSRPVATCMPMLACSCWIFKTISCSGIDSVWKRLLRRLALTKLLHRLEEQWGFGYPSVNSWRIKIFLLMSKRRVHKDMIVLYWKRRWSFVSLSRYNGGVTLSDRSHNLWRYHDFKILLSDLFMEDIDALREEYYWYRRRISVIWVRRLVIYVFDKEMVVFVKN